MENHLSNNPYDSKIIAHIWQVILDASHVMLLTHTKPDGDGASACAAFEKILHALGKTSETVYPTPCDFALKYQSTALKINEHTATPDLLIAFDIANIERMYYPLSFAKIPLINIDHHISNNINGTWNVVDASASSACEVLYNLLKDWCPELVTKEVAQALLYGILYDTQVFHTQNTSAHTLRVSADLMDKGAPLFELKTDLLSHKNPSIIKLWGDIMGRISISPHQNVVWTAVSHKDLEKYNLELSSLGGFVNFLAEIAGIDVAVLFYEVQPEETKVSLRSKKADVNAVAKQFGGGGHKNASGVTIKMPLDDAINALKPVLEQLR